MMRYSYVLVLCCLLLKTAAASDGNLSQTAVGWCGAGGDLSGIPQQAEDIWTGRSSWSDLTAVGWPYAHADFTAYVQQNPNGVTDFATGLIPHALPSTQWNGLLDQVVSGAEDSVFVAEGQNMAKYGTKTVYCRPWWEMTISVANLDPAKFQAAWNHAIPIIRSAFAAAAPNKTLKIAFCYLPDSAGDPKPFFPDPKNVDVIDADIYGKVWSTTTPSQATLLAAIQKDLNTLEAFATAENKPAGVSEWANVSVRPQGVVTNQGRGDDPEYIDLMLSFGAQNHFLYMVYYNISVGGVGQTFADTPLSLAHFRAALTSTSSQSTTTSSVTTSPAGTSSTGTSATGASATGASATGTSATGTSATGTSATGTSATGASSASTSSQPSTTFSSWQTRYFTPTQLADPTVSGPTADPYGSGVPNLLAYALELDPSTAQPSDIPQATPSNGHLVMSYLVPSALTDVAFVPEVSSDLQTWTSGSTVVQTVSSTVGPNGTTVIVQDCLPASTAKRFMRLRVTQQQ